MAKMNESEMFNKSPLCMGRFAVPGGWLYFSNLNGAASPAFVPDPCAEHVVGSVKPTVEALRNEYNRGRESALRDVVEYLQNSTYSFVTIGLIRYFADRAPSKEKP